jgi:hypothetical protein
VVYPGEMFFDGQLVAIEENRLIFRRDVVWPMAVAKRLSRLNRCASRALSGHGCESAPPMLRPRSCKAGTPKSNNSFVGVILLDGCR